MVRQAHHDRRNCLRCPDFDGSCVIKSFKCLCCPEHNDSCVILKKKGSCVILNKRGSCVILSLTKDDRV